MDVLIDCTKLHDALPKEQGVIKGILRQIIGAYSISNDLEEAKRQLETFFKWHIERIVPIRDGPTDDTEEAWIGRAVFIAGMFALCRALDSSSQGRIHVDLTKAFRGAGLLEAAKSILDFRNNELAHFGAFKHRGRNFTHDIPVLIATPDGKTHINKYYSRAHSSGELAYNALKMSEVGLIEANRYFDAKRTRLLTEIRNSRWLRDFIQAQKLSLGFKPPSPFDNIEIPLDMGYKEDGPSLSIQWDQSFFRI